MHKRRFLTLNACFLNPGTAYKKFAAAKLLQAEAGHCSGSPQKRSDSQLRLQQHVSAQVCLPAVSRRSRPVGACVQQALGALRAAGQRRTVQRRQRLRIVRV